MKIEKLLKLVASVAVIPLLLLSNDKKCLAADSISFYPAVRNIINMSQPYDDFYDINDDGVINVFDAIRIKQNECSEDYVKDLAELKKEVTNLKDELNSQKETLNSLSEYCYALNNESLDITPSLESGGIEGSTGNITNNNKRVRTEFVYAASNIIDIIIPNGFKAYVIYCDKNKNRIGSSGSWIEAGTTKITAVSGTYYIRAMIQSVPESVISPTDIIGFKYNFDNQLDKTLREVKTNNSTDWDLNVLISAGLYNHYNTSPFATNVPVGEDGAKPFKLFNFYNGSTPSTSRQLYWSYTTGNIYTRHCIGANNFSDWRQLAYEKTSAYTFDASAKILNINTPKCNYVFKQVIDDSIRLNAWRLYQGDLKVGNSTYNMWTNSDAEGVLKLQGEDDHISGYHGDELNGTCAIYVDGIPINMSVNSSGTFEKLTIKCSSDVYHCQTSDKASTKAFERKKELNFTADSYRIHQEWKAVDNVKIDRGAQALFQCYKSSNGTTILYGMDSDDIVGMQSTDFNDSTIYLDKSTLSVRMFTIGGEIKITALQGYDNEYYTPQLRDFASQNRDKIYLDMFNGKSFEIGEKVYTGFKVEFN